MKLYEGCHQWHTGNKRFILTFTLDWKSFGIGFSIDAWTLNLKLLFFQLTIYKKQYGEEEIPF